MTIVCRECEVFDQDYYDDIGDDDDVGEDYDDDALFLCYLSVILSTLFSNYAIGLINDRLQGMRGFRPRDSERDKQIDG